ncbi:MULTISPECIES: S-methylmethionine permease [unclassified Bacillus (in: firmicutes)]|uniref:S-methylmethionine permease n=1 Tax=unclassified Bacillus (in: firmicutes) TaxID=185979 RepID=UPI000BEF7AC3|nr:MULTISPECIES: S-methylmethionine permease [unclassified Bacillus (in: firmicutes)]PEJ57138.1 amino acid permease [Bacillus sp. AFS002410]PEL14056.1 amino acid permease [Bacillus sp. AFS017336]
MGNKNGQEFQRNMQARHLVMLSLGGVIGTGLFLSSGYTIQQAGPFGTILSYLIGALVVYLVMLCLGELSVHMPETGSFHSYAVKYIGPATGYTVAWLYWLTWTVALGSEFTAAGLLMKRWFPSINVWIWSAIFAILIFVLNVMTVKFFAESEFWFSSIKVIAIVIFIVLGAAAMLGFLPMSHSKAAPLFSNFTSGGLFPHGATGIIMTMLAVNFAFSGTELIGIAAGETANPEKMIPKAIRTTLWRLIIFFVGTIFVLSALLPISDAGVLESPFVAVLERIGVPYSADIMNFVILTAILSAANSGLYASSRMLWSLANKNTISPIFGKMTKQGVPINAVIFSMVGGALALLSSIVAPDTVYIVLVSISGLAVVVVWMSISASQFLFRRQFLKEGNSEKDLIYRTPLYPLVPIASFILCLASCIGIAFDPTQRIALYCGIPFILFCYGSYYLTKNLKKRGVDYVEQSQSN